MWFRLDMSSLQSALKKLSRRRGLSPGATAEAEKPKQTPSGSPSLPADFDEAAKQIIALVRPFTMTSPQKLFALITAVRHVANTGLEGAIVECGVWRGGLHARSGPHPR